MVFLVTFPNLDFELELLRTAETIVSLDEVGRGAIAGPVVVGASVFNRSSSLVFPDKLRDSKLVAESKRDHLAELTMQWLKVEVGIIDADTIDEIGITAALKAAALQAIAKLELADKFLILLDGSHNWIGADFDVKTKTKADRDCASVSASSIVAKVWRDNRMRELAQQFPGYGLESNKGYASEGHIIALREFGPSPIHRKSWLTRILSEQQTLF